MTEIFQQSCGCSDCEAAVSPAAYLTALLDFALKHIRQNGTDKIAPQFLEDTFHQPFFDLPTDCEAVEKQIRQVRICVEVLRSYLGIRPLADPAKEEELAKSEKDYRFAVYSMLLNRLGTTYEEIRRIRNETPENRKALAERLGIDLTEPRPADVPDDEDHNGDELDQLFLDPNAELPKDHILAEYVIEKFFGFVDTTRDPLSEGLKLGDDKGQIVRWNLNGAEWRRNTDSEGMVHMSLLNPAVTEFRVDVYQDAARTKLVASGIADTASATVKLVQKNDSGLSGVVEIAYIADTSSIVIAAIPIFLIWQLKHLRTLWAQQDHPKDVYSEGTSPKLPIIDPDLIGPDDFRHPFQKANAGDPDKAFDFWLARRAFVDNTLDDLKTERENNGLTTILEKVLGDPLPDIDGLLATLTKGGTKDEIKTAKDKVVALGLTVDSFTRLMSIRTKDQLAQRDDRNEPVGEEEWREVYSILTQAAKIKKFDTWRTEEKNAEIRLGFEEFWFSLQEPKEGNWPPVPRKDQPFIDPDLVKLPDLPEWLAGKEAIAIWNDRKAIIDQLPNKLKTEREKTNNVKKSFEAMLRLALGHPKSGNPLQHNLDTLKKDLGSMDESVRDGAVKKIETDLHLTVERFKRLMVIKAANDQNDPAKKPTSIEWDELYALLTPARKVKHEYPAWLKEEKAKGLVYWKTLKASLPRWRANIEARQTWQQALRVRSQRPIIDPTVIGPEDVRHKLTGDPAYDLWKVRYDGRVTLLKNLKAAAPDDLNGLDKVIKETLGFEASDLAAIDQERRVGHSIEKRLEQLGLINGAFTFLMRIRGLAKDAQPITDSEWDIVYSTLAQSKLQREFAALRDDEQDKSIFLSPDFFKIPKTLLTPLPFLDPATPFWLSTWQARRDWQDALQSRIDQENSTIEALRSAISTVEEATLPGLRHALIQVTDAVGANLDEKAKWITERLLIDAKAGGCQMTTRVAQAIETIQMLIFDLRTGQFKYLATFPLSLVPNDIDEEWKWIGSYATWRAAMFVFLYPENILHPSLRERRQTPDFETFIANTRLRLDQNSACTVAKTYADYFRDVCSLQIEATCQALTQVHSGNKCQPNTTEERHLFYMFGRASSGRVYWSAYDSENSSGYAQSFWQEISAFKDVKILRIVGAMPYERSELVKSQEITGGPWGNKISVFGKRVFSNNIYLFCISEDKNGLTSFGFVKFKLDSFGLDSAWDNQIIPLKLEGLGNISSLKIVPVQTSSPYDVPSFVIKDPGKASISGFYIYLRQLNEGASDWERPELGWHDFGGIEFLIKNSPSKPDKSGAFSYAYRLSTQLHAAYRIGEKFFVAYTDNTGDLSIAPITVGVITTHALFLGEGTWVGALLESNRGLDSSLSNYLKHHAYVFYKTSSQTVYQRIDKTLLVDNKYYTISDLQGLAPHSGSAPDGQQVFACQRGKNKNSYYYFRYRESNDQLVGSSSFRAVPRVVSPLDIPERLSSNQLEDRRQAIEKAFALNSDATPSILTYLQEAYFFVPIHLALQLQSAGQYLASLDWFRTVYNYEAEIGPPNKRNIYYGLELDAKLPDIPIYQQADDWLRDPLNPHLIAATRRYSYTRFTLLSLVRCLLDYADSEFTQDTSESLARARTLYLTALDLLNLPELHQILGGCDDIIAELKIEPGKDVPPEVPAVVDGIIENLTKSLVRFLPFYLDVVEELGSKLSQNASWDQKLSEARTVVAMAIAKASLPPATGAVIATNSSTLKEKYSKLLIQESVDNALQSIGKAAAWESSAGVGQPDPGGMNKPTGFPSPKPLLGSIVGPTFQFCIPPNPVLKGLRLRAELNLTKLRSCRNIAGIKRELDSYVAPTDITTGLSAVGASGQLLLPGISKVTPTAYRYTTLIERTKQLIQLAAQIEAQMLSSLEKLDTESFNLLKVRQELDLAQAGIHLQDLHINQAKGEVQLAVLQQARADTQQRTYERWLSEGMNSYELELFKNYESLRQVKDKITDANKDIQFYQVNSPSGSDIIGGVVHIIRTGERDAARKGVIDIWQQSTLLNEVEYNIGVNTLKTSYEYRRRDWELQVALAKHDVDIGTHQISLANDRVQIVEQERVISELQANNAKDMVNFLTHKFTNINLYNWMSGILEGIYRYFLQQATAMAKLAEDQLVFERQEISPDYIQADYWNNPPDGVAVSRPNNFTPDRNGLTGSARLLQDIYVLDQYAFNTHQRKLQLTKTLSLALLAPAEFQSFRETGLMAFATPMELFDRDFPGHYLRLIRRVRTSVIALIPPTQGIHATLTSTGLSRTVIGPYIFQTVPICRDPEYVALTSPASSTGMFELEPLQSDMLLPFEGNGVDSTWEFRMPKAANQFDYRTIADVLITIEYTALNSFDYRQQVVQTLNPNLSADRPFSFRNQFADQWYDLHNPDQTKTPMKVRFQTFREDFSPNLETIKIQQVLLYFVRTSQKTFELPITELRFTEEGNQGTVGGSAAPIDGVISTRRGNGGSWTAMKGKFPAGEWELTLPNTEEMKNRFKNEEIEDILLVITYSGRTPEWPV